MASKPYDRPSSASSSAANTPNKVGQLVFTLPSVKLILYAFISLRQQAVGVCFVLWLVSYILRLVRNTGRVRQEAEKRMKR
jgi:hypothetical protein